MYKVYKVSAGAMANGRLQEFDPVKNNFEWDGYTTEMIDPPDMAYGKAPPERHCLWCELRPKIGATRI